MGLKRSINKLREAVGGTEKLLWPLQSRRVATVSARAAQGTYPPLTFSPSIEWADEAGDQSAEHLSFCLGGSSGALPLQQKDVAWAVAPITAQQDGLQPHTL